MEAAQIMKKVFIKNLKASQIIYIFISKVQIFHVINNLSKARANGITIIARILSEEYIEDNDFILLLLIIALHHGKFVQVC